MQQAAAWDSVVLAMPSRSNQESHGRAKRTRSWFTRRLRFTALGSVARPRLHWVFRVVTLRSPISPSSRALRIDFRKLRRSGVSLGYAEGYIVESFRRFLFEIDIHGSVCWRGELVGVDSAGLGERKRQGSQLMSLRVEEFQFVMLLPTFTSVGLP